MAASRNAENPGNGAGKPTVKLFNGRTLTGWSAADAGAASNWVAHSGVLQSIAKGPSLATTQKFGDFSLHLEFALPRGCNSGVFLRGRYEVQLVDAVKPPAPKASCGAIYNLIAPSRAAYVGPDRWNKLDVTLVGNVVTVKLNGTEIIDAQRITGVTNGALDRNEAQPGPILLQAQTAVGAKFRNITIKPLD